MDVLANVPGQVYWLPLLEDLELHRLELLDVLQFPFVVIVRITLDVTSQDDQRHLLRVLCL